jgi:phage protein D
MNCVHDYYPDANSNYSVKRLQLQQQQQQNERLYLAPGRPRLDPQVDVWFQVQAKIQKCLVSLQMSSSTSGSTTNGYTSSSRISSKAQQQERICNVAHKNGVLPVTLYNKRCWYNKWHWL